MNTKSCKKLIIWGVLAVSILLLASAQVWTVQAVIGDVDISGLVDGSDLTILDGAYYAYDYSGNWDPRADINLDDWINLRDLALAGRSYTDLFNFHVPKRISNGRNNNPALTGVNWCDAAVDGMGRVHVFWQESDQSAHTFLFYTQLDFAGNALIEDVLLDTNLSDAKIAVGPDGSAHIIHSDENGNLRYHHLNPDGSFISTGIVFDEYFSTGHPAIAVDAYNHAHIVYTERDKKAMYKIIGNNSQLLPAAQLNPGSVNIVESYAITISPDGARHILWHVYLDGYDELRYTRISEDGVVTLNDHPVVTLEGSYNHRHYYLAADSESAVHLLYYDFRDSNPGIYWTRVNPDGTFEDERLISSDGYAAASHSVPFVIDTSDQIHFTAYWNSANGHRGYGRLDRNGNILIPFQRAAFESNPYNVDIAVNEEGQAMILAVSEYYPRLYIYSTVSDIVAYDLNRADLVLDKAHIDVTKYLLKITEAAEISIGITNGGPADATGVVVHFSYLDMGGGISTIDVPVDDIPAYTSLSMNQSIAVPDFEEVDAWEVIINVSTSTPETSMDNNTVSVPFGVFPPPRKFNLEVLPFDETYAPEDQSNAIPLEGAEISLFCEATGYTELIESSDIFNIFWDIPLNTDPANAPLYPTACVVTVTKTGFSSSSMPVSAQRQSVANPYEIALTVRPIELYINTWGEIEGQLTDSFGSAIQNARVILEFGREVLSDSHGRYDFDKVPAGHHSLSVWAAGFEPVQDYPLVVEQGNKTSLNFSMVETSEAEVFGSVINGHFLPLAGALVKFYEDSTLKSQSITGNDGTFSFSIDPYQDSSSYRLETSLNNYEDSTDYLGGLIPGIPLEYDVILQPIVGNGDLSTSGEIKSWVQDERWCKAYGDEEDLPLTTQILEWIGSKWCPSFQTVVNWGAFDYEMGLNYSESIDGNTVIELLVNFTNKEFISYEVSGGGWESGGESLSVTAQRIDWVELIAIDEDGNLVGEYLWHDDTVQYSSLQADPVNPSWRFDINTIAPNWSQAAIRIFYTIGQYDETEENNFRNWNPPADLGLIGSGSPSGAHQQVITWMLSNNESEKRYALTDYRSWLHPPNCAATPTKSLPYGAAATNEGINTIDSSSLSVLPVVDGPARIGLSYAVDIVISGFDSRPVYAVQFDLDYNESYLRLIDVQPAADFSGLYGSWHRDLDLEEMNTAGKLTREAVVRLAAPSGLEEGSVVRLVFMPVQFTPPGVTTKLDLGGTITLADIYSDLFNADSIVDLLVTVENANIFLPIIIK